MAHHEPHAQSTGGTLNWLRAAVLGANDGIVSVSSIVVGVAGASDSAAFILTAGVAGLVAGALSMAVGEYVSVSTQRDTEKALLEKERAELREYPQQELEELAGLYEMKGLSKPTARTVARSSWRMTLLPRTRRRSCISTPNDLTNPGRLPLLGCVVQRRRHRADLGRRAPRPMPRGFPSRSSPFS